MLKKFLLLLFSMVLFAVLMLAAGCATPGPAEPVGDIEETATFTMDEIAEFDGEDGRPAYIVVDGVVYDVTNVRQWQSGTHFGFEAGTDVTDALANAAPHGAGQLNQAEIVGIVVE